MSKVFYLNIYFKTETYSVKKNPEFFFFQDFCIKKKKQNTFDHGINLGLLLW